MIPKNLMPVAGCGLSLLAAMVTAGCGHDESQAYVVPKESPVVNTAAPAVSQGPLEWSTPSSWLERPAEGMRVASFAVQDKNGRAADISVVPLPGNSGSMSANVNRWRSQVNLEPISEEEITKAIVKADIGGGEGTLYEVASTAPVLDNKSKTRILAAVISQGDTTWFFKMTGEDTIVSEQKPAFLAFLKSIRFRSGTAQAQEAAALPTMAGQMPENAAGGLQTHPDWQVPAAWHPAPASAMLVAKFIVHGMNGAVAEVNISTSKGAGGGIEANVQRWRGQLGLGPAANTADMANLVQKVAVNGGEASSVDMTGTNQATGKPARLIALIVPAGEDTWFYKLMGDTAVVGKERDVFIKFVQTVKY